MTYRPRVFIHDGAGRRIAELPRASTRRAFRTMTVGQAVAVVAENEPNLSLCDPRDGRLLVVESDIYPLIWAGPIISREGGPDGTISLQARSYEAVLQERYLPYDYIGTGTSGSQFRDLLRTVEIENPTGVSASRDIAAGEPFDDTNYGDRSLFDAWNIAAQQTQHEWWLVHAVDAGQLVTVAQFRPWRGTDRTGQLRLVAGAQANCRVNRWRDSVESTYRVRAVAGSTSATQGYSERTRVQRRAGKAPIGTAALTIRANTRHGYDFGKWPVGNTPLTRGDQLAILEAVRGAGSLTIAADAYLAKGRAAQRAAEVEVFAHGELWQYAQPGDVVRLNLPPYYFVDGIDTHAAIMDVDVFEEGGSLRLNIEVPAA